MYNRHFIADINKLAETFGQIVQKQHMEKSKIYKDALFDVEIIKESIEKFVDKQKTKKSYRLKKENETWEYDDEREFFADYRKSHESSTLRKSNENINITISYTKNSDTTISIKASSRGEIESAFEIFEKNYKNSVVEITKEVKSPIIFIGHGRSIQWRDLKDHLGDKHDFKIEAYETGARAGHQIKDILEDMSSKSTFAILVMTAEDKDDNGKFNARPNVIHEIGLFQGKLGFSKAIVLLEDSTEEFSNLQGIQQLRYSKGNIKETFGDVLATIKREFENKK